MSWVLVAALVVASAVAFVLRLPPPASGLSLWLGLGLPYLCLGALAVLRLRRDGLLVPLLRFRPGDPSLGIGLGVLLLVCTWMLSRWLVPLDSVAHAWLFRIFLVVGDVSSSAASACLLTIAALEELVWRGWVQTELSSRLGVRRGWVACAVLYAAAHAATLSTLSDPVAGPNPLIVLCALGCGLCWGFLRERSGRIMAGLISHVVFTYLASQYLGRFV
jgi:membrane protease YdiL (CAAX protease family)